MIFRNEHQLENNIESEMETRVIDQCRSTKLWLPVGVPFYNEAVNGLQISSPDVLWLRLYTISSSSARRQAGFVQLRDKKMINTMVTILILIINSTIILILSIVIMITILITIIKWIRTDFALDFGRSLCSIEMDPKP